jgi:protein-disulfide isomerase
MNKKILLSTLIGTSLLLTSCGWTKDTQENLTGAGSLNNSQNVELDWVTNLEMPTIYVVHGSKEMINDQPEGLVFLDDNSDISKAFDSAMNEESWKFIRLEPTAEAKEQGIEPIDIQIWKYAPLFVFDAATPEFDYDRIMDENADLVYSVVVDNKTYFAFKDPSFLGSGKESVTINDEATADLYKATMSLNESSLNDGTIILVEDPLCPFCAQEFLSWNHEELIKNYNARVLFLALPIPGHENSEALINFMELNKDENWVLDSALLRAIFEKQDDLKNISITDGENIKTILRNSSYADSVDQLKVWDLTTWFDLVESERIATILWVTWTPSVFFQEWNKYKFILNETDI